MQTVSRPIGGHLREWRQRRHLSQLALACDADISTKHLSFIETGRALPSRDMVLHLAERLEVPLRDRNTLLVAAGYAPVFPERPLKDPALGAARKVVDLVLAGHEPYPALAVDRHWTLIAANDAVALLLEGVEPSLVSPPVNVLRLGLHPAGLAPRIINFVEWRPHLLARLRRQIDLTADPILIALLDEIGSYPTPEDARYRGPPASRDYANAVVPLQLVLDGGALSLFSMTTVFGTPVDITLSELALEAFLPADAATAEALHRLAAAKS
jgi:transcriptional regulator with XRE-family HTH domain